MINVGHHCSGENCRVEFPTSNIYPSLVLPFFLAHFPPAYPPFSSYSSLFFPLPECMSVWLQAVFICVWACCDVDTYSPTKPFLKVNVPGPGYMLEARQPENCSPPCSSFPLRFFLSLLLFTCCVLYPPECIPRCEQALEHVCSLFRDTPPFNQTSYHTHTLAKAKNAHTAMCMWRLSITPRTWREGQQSNKDCRALSKVLNSLNNGSAASVLTSHYYHYLGEAEREVGRKRERGETREETCCRWLRDVKALGR